MISYEAVLSPTSDLTQLTGHLLSLPALLAEVTRCCLTAMNEHDSFEAQVAFLPDSRYTLEEAPSSLPPTPPHHRHQVQGQLP